jgi:hypothetical protein
VGPVLGGWVEVYRAAGVTSNVMVNDLVVQLLLDDQFSQGWQVTSNVVVNDLVVRPGW